MKGKTSTGYKFDVDETILDDIEFLEKIADAFNDGFTMFRVIEDLLGKDGKKRLYDHVRNDKGKATLSAVSDELGEIFDALSKEPSTKN